MRLAAFLVFILVSIIGSPQATRPPMYDTCNYLRPLEGEWVSINGSDTIKIYLRFHRSIVVDPETFNFTSDQLWGWIEYKQGSTIVTSDYANRFSNLPYNLDSLTPGLKSIILWAGKASGVIRSVGYVGCQNTITELGGILVDIPKCKSDKTIIATVNGNSPGSQMTWLVMQNGGNVPPACVGVTLPETFVLTKQ